MFGANKVRRAFVMVTALTAIPAHADSPPSPAAAETGVTTNLQDQFRDPPNSARPRVWWHWMNGNISKDGIAKDMAWMKRVGIGGLQNFDANLTTPLIVDHRIAYMTPEWKDAFRFAASESERLGLELAIASSPGWSETGGPWVPAEDGLKKLVWSETLVKGGKAFIGVLPPPPSITGPFQSIPKGRGVGELLGGGTDPARLPTRYVDVAVLAYPADGVPAFPSPKVVSQDGQAIDASLLFDSDLSSVVEIAKGTAKSPAALILDYGKPLTARSASLYVPGSTMLFFGASVEPRLEVSDDRTSWKAVAEMPATEVPTTVSFDPVTGRYFRIVFAPAKTSAMAALSALPPGIDLSAMAALAGGAMGGKPLRIGDLRLSSDPRVDRFEAKAGNAIESDYYALSQTVPETAGIAASKVIDLSDKMRPNGTLDWTPPKGNWRILRLGYSLLGTENHPATAEATGLEVDKFDGAAVQRYLDHYLGMYRDAVGKGLMGANGVRALLTDSIEVGAANWTPRMIEQFRRLRGYDPMPWLPALTGVLIESREKSDRFLYDYRRTLADLMASEHYGTIATVAHQNGLQVYGEALEDHRPSLGDDMAMRRHTDVPMAAMWTFPAGGQPRNGFLADIKGAASVAHIYGQNLVAAESLTSVTSYWRDSPATLKNAIDLEFVTGVNRSVIHTSVHQPSDDKVPGLSLFIFGQYFNRHESWADMAKPWVDYISRNALMLQQGRNVADVAYFYGEESPLTALYGDKRIADAPRTSAYDFINADALADAVTNDGSDIAAKGGARYRLLYLGGSALHMTLPTLRRIAALAEGGATIVGMRPQGNPSLAGDPDEYVALLKLLWSGGAETVVGKGRVIASTDVEAALRSIGSAPDFRFEGGQADSDIPFLHRKLADGDSYFIANRKNRVETIEAHFRVTGKAPELWHAETGTSEAVSYHIANGETVVPLTLTGEESVHVVFRNPAAASALAIKKLAPVALGRVEGEWTVQFQPGRGAPASTTMATLAPLNENADPGIRYFSGSATYATGFVTPKGWKLGQPLWIDLGAVHELAEVSINGKAAGTVWHAPYRLDIGILAKPGRNRLEVKVANLWVNRLIGDAQPGATKISWTALPSYLKSAPLMASGLIGPVTLLGIQP